MSRPLVSVVMASYERGALLSRSLSGYETQAGVDPKTDLELVVIDDHSLDNTRDMVLSWSRRTGIRATVMTCAPKPGEWVDCGWVLNAGIRASRGKHVLLTHPEVIPGRKSVAACVDELENWEYEFRRLPRHKFEGCRIEYDTTNVGLYASCRVYYMGPRDQVLIDTVDWYSKGALAVREIEGFYDEDGNGNPDYMHRATDIVAQPGSRLPTWESWVFGGCSRETWNRLGGMLETNKWGSVDIAWMARRRALGIPNHTCPNDDTICVHQNHNLPGDVITPRCMETWVKELKDVDLVTPSKLVYPAVDHL